MCIRDRIIGAVPFRMFRVLASARSLPADIILLAEAAGTKFSELREFLLYPLDLFFNIFLNKSVVIGRRELHTSVVPATCLAVIVRWSLMVLIGCQASTCACQKLL